LKLKADILKIKLFFKLGIFLNTFISSKRFINFNNYLIGLRFNRALLNINKAIFLFYRSLLFLQTILLSNGKILIVEKNLAAFNFLLNNSLLSSFDKKKSHIIGILSNLDYLAGDFLLPGILSNFNVIRWNYILDNEFIFKKKPNLIILLNFDNSANIIYKEATKIGIPLITFCNFHIFNITRISYPILSSFLLKLDTYLFFCEILFLYLYIFRKINKKICVPLIDINNQFFCKLFASIKYRKINRVNLIKNKFNFYTLFLNYGFKLKKYKQSRKKKKKKKKWRLRRLRKFKLYSIYSKKFIKCGAFGIRLKHSFQYSYLLKRIFFNFFDFQYNFYSMSRKVRRCSLFNKLRIKKKHSRLLNKALYFTAIFERQLIFTLKRFFFIKTFKAGIYGLKLNRFFANGLVITNPYFLVLNNNIIQKAYFNYYSIKQLWHKFKSISSISIKFLKIFRFTLGSSNNQKVIRKQSLYLKRRLTVTKKKFINF
jgi:hypothetical protein